jgi:hypothetical protein
MVLRWVALGAFLLVTMEAVRAEDLSPIETGVLDTVVESLIGDAYDPARWRPLSFGSFLSEGWFEPWASAPAGREGLAPRHGWLGAFEAVFYRLWLTPFTYTHDLARPRGGDGYAGNFAIFLPFSRRFEVFLNDPYIVSSGSQDPRRGYRHDFGDLIVTPRFLLQEDEVTSQVFNLEIRTPTGQPATGGHVMALTPRYGFWVNPAGAWVVRGAAGCFIPLSTSAAASSVVRPIPPFGVRSVSQTSFIGGLAVGRFFRPHDVPFGDLVFYAASNLSVPLAGGYKNTFVGIGPGTRFHIANNYYLLNYWEFPVTRSREGEYSVQFALLKMF